MLIEGLSSDSTSEINGRARSQALAGVGSMKVDVHGCRSPGAGGSPMRPPV